MCAREPLHLQVGGSSTLNFSASICPVLNFAEKSRFGMRTASGAFLRLILDATVLRLIPDVTAAARTHNSPMCTPGRAGGIRRSAAVGPHYYIIVGSRSGPHLGGREVHAGLLLGAHQPHQYLRNAGGIQVCDQAPQQVPPLLQGGQAGCEVATCDMLPPVSGRADDMMVGARELDVPR